MNRSTHLAISVAILALAALAGVTAARWRNQADLRADAKPMEPLARTLRVDRAGPAPAEADRSRKRQEDLLEDAGVLFRTPHPGFLLVNEQGQVLDHGLTESGVSLERRPQIQAALDAAWARIFASMKERVEPDERNSNPEQGIRAYLIPARMGLREEILGKLETDFSAICGAETAALLIRSVHSGAPFGYFGRQSLMIRIGPGPDGTGKQASFSSFDPISGNKVLSGTATTPEQLRVHFGDAIPW